MHDPARSPPWADGPYSIKRHGVTITNCDSEPVQTPGCIQAHGALIVVRPEDFVILQASENVDTILGIELDELLQRPLATAFGPEFAARFARFLGTEPVDRNPLYFVTLPERAGVSLDVTVHTVDEVALLEFEETRRSECPEPDYYALVKKTVARLQATETVARFCAVLTQEMRILTGFDRVMAYRFHDDGHGEVFAEAKEESLAGWRGLHYPAEDIPRPARDVFLRTWVRPVPDIHGKLAELVPLAHPQTGRPLTMTWCALRGASVMYTEYLQNMRVRAALTLPIRLGEQLWGLIACHHYAGARHTPFQVRAACEFVAQVASLLLKAVVDREELEYRVRIEGVHNQLVAQAAQEGGLAAMTDGKPALLDGLDAHGAALFHRERWWTVGRTPTNAELDALGVWLNARPEFESPLHPIYATDALAREYPRGAGIADIASGVLAFPLSRTRKNLMVWFRPETIRTIDWAGNPHETPTVTGPHGPRLTPRKSFELFKESVKNRSLPWKAAEIDAAARLRLMVMELVVSRAERLAELNADLARSNEELDAFAYVASHDLKEPLRGIHKYAYQLLEDAAVSGEENRRKLEALARLTLRMDSLLDALLHFSRVGRTALRYEKTDLNEVVSEAVEMVSARASTERVEITVPRRLPQAPCDGTRCREIFVNLISNALKYNDHAHKSVEVGYITPDEAHDRPGAPDGVAEHIIYYVKDNGIGIERRHYPHLFQMFRRLHPRDAYGGGSGAGLAIVKKLVARHGGQIWVDSTPGTGSTFYFHLPCAMEAEQ